MNRSSSYFDGLAVQQHQTTEPVKASQSDQSTSTPISSLASDAILAGSSSLPPRKEINGKQKLSSEEKQRIKEEKLHQKTLKHLHPEAAAVYLSIQEGTELSHAQSLAKTAYTITKGTFSNDKPSLVTYNTIQNAYLLQHFYDIPMSQEDKDLYFFLGGEAGTQDERDELDNDPDMKEKFYRLLNLQQKNVALENTWNDIYARVENIKSRRAMNLLAEKIDCLQDSLDILDRPDAELLLDSLDHLTNEKALLILKLLPEKLKEKYEHS